MSNSIKNFKIILKYFVNIMSSSVKFYGNNNIKKLNYLKLVIIC